MVSLTTTTGADEPLAGLVDRAARGDEAAFARIVRLHHADMTRVCFVVGGDPDVAQEAVAAAWPIAWKRLGSLREPDRLRPWLVSVAANEARLLVRRRSRRSVVELAVAADGAATWPDLAGRAADLDLANTLARLAPDDRALLALRCVARLNSTELGRATGMSASSTRARLARLLDRLRSELDDASWGCTAARGPMIAARPGRTHHREDGTQAPRRAPYPVTRPGEGRREGGPRADEGVPFERIGSLPIPGNEDTSDGFDVALACLSWSTRVEP